MNGMSRRAIILMGLLAGALCTLLVYVLIAGTQRSVQQKSRQVPVVVAYDQIPARTEVKEGMVAIETRAIGTLPPGVATRLDEVVGKVARVDIPRGPIVQAQLAAKDPGVFGLAIQVPKFMRAVTVAIDPIIGVAGFLQPGDHVDVVATFMEGKAAVTKTVLQDVELLAKGKQIVEESPQPQSGIQRISGEQAGQPQEAPNATLAVSPGDAEKLILAESMGKLRLTLRPIDDTDQVALRGVSSVALVGAIPQPAKQVGAAGGSRPAPVVREVVYRPEPMSSFAQPHTQFSLSPAQVQPVQPLPQRTVEVYRGTDKEVVPVTQ